MDPKFIAITDQLAPRLMNLLAMPPLKNGGQPRSMSRSGVYLFTERGKHMYVGQSNDLQG